MIDIYTAVKTASLPFGGSLKSWCEVIASMIHTKVMPLAKLDSLEFIDLTCGGGSTSMFLASYGATGHLNDLALRSLIATDRVFGGVTLTAASIAKACKVKPGKMTSEVRLFAEGFLLSAAVDTFESLYYAEGSEAEKKSFRYLALRYALTMKTVRYFTKIPTQDVDELGRDLNYAKVIEPSLNPLDRLTALNARMAALDVFGCNKLGWRMRQGSMLDFPYPAGDSGKNKLILCNPPTRGNSEFVQSNRLIDAMLENKLHPYKTNQPKVDSFVEWQTLMSAAHPNKVPYPEWKLLTFCDDGEFTQVEGGEFIRSMGYEHVKTDKLVSLWRCSR